VIDKIDKNRRFQGVMVVTENRPHVLEARQLGMAAIHFKGPGKQRYCPAD